MVFITMLSIVEGMREDREIERVCGERGYREERDGRENCER